MKNLYINKLADILNESKYIYHGTIKLKPVAEKSSTYIDLDVESNDKFPKFEAGDHTRISKYKNIFSNFKRRFCN